MANQEHLAILRQGVATWNKWREGHSQIRPDLSWAELRGANLRRANLHRANLMEADLRGTDLSGAHLCEANLMEVDVSEANLIGADVSEAKLVMGTLWKAELRGANLSWANLHKANLCEADLRWANLRRAQLIETDLTNADIRGCDIYGISAWDVRMEDTKQENLRITPFNQLAITVDTLKVAQFIYLLLTNTEIRDVIDTIARKVVLILGRFTEERKQVLDALRDELRKHNYSPIVFDFEKPVSRDLTETVSILARLSRFIIADITDPSCIPQELYAVVPDCLVPVQPLLSSQPMLIDGIEVERRPYSMFNDLQRRYHWVLPTYRYQDTNQLLSSINDQIITPAEEKGRELERKKNSAL